MDIFVLCIAVENHHSNVGWGALLIEPEGFIEEQKGNQSTQQQAIIKALLHTLPMVPSGQRLAIRGMNPSISHFGKTLLPKWQKLGAHEKHLTEDIRRVLDLLRNLETVWMNSSRYPQPGDVRAGILAKEGAVNPSFPKKEPPVAKQNQIEPQTKPNVDKSMPPKEAEPLSENHKKIEQIELLFGTRLIAYVDAFNHQNRGSWSCILIDRKSRSALLKSDALFAAPMKLLIQATLEVLDSLKQPGQKIEIRSSHRNLIQLGESWIWDWQKRGWKKKGGKTIADLPLVQKLYDYLKNHKIQWKHIPASADEYGIQHSKLLTQAALKALECGEIAKITSRQQNYPTYQLL